MNLFKKGFNRAGKFLKQLSTKSERLIFSSYDRESGAQWSDSDYLKKTAISLYLNKAIKKRAEKVAEVEWVLKKDGDIVEEPTSKVLELLKKPNDFFSGAEFIELYQKYKDITGRAFIWKEKNGQEVVGLHLLRPDMVKINISSGKITSYIFSKGNGQDLTYLPEEIIYSFHPDPLNQLNGESIIRAGTRAVDTQLQIEEYQSTVIKNGGKVEGVFQVDTPRITEEQLISLKAQYQKQYGSAKKSGLPMFLSGQLDYKKIGLTPTELDYLETKKISIDDIVIMTGVPKAILASITDAKYNNAQASERIFISHTILPLIKNLRTVLNNNLTLDEGYQLDFIDPTPVNTEELLKRIETADKVSALTINEMRNELGYEDIEGGDVLQTDIRRMPYTPPAEEPKEEPTDVKSVDDKVMHPLRNKAFRNQYGERKDKELIREEKRMAGEMKNYFEEQGKELIEKIEKTQGIPEIRTVFNVDEENEKARKIIFPLLTAVLINAGESTRNFVNAFAKSEISDFLVDVTIRTWLQQRAEVFGGLITNTTMKDLTEVFTIALATNSPHKSLVKGIQDLYKGYSEHRAETIARTEVHGAFQKGNYEGYRQAQVPTKIWVTVGDGNVRDSHSVLDGTEIPFANTFDNGLKYPGDINGSAGEVINCRCTI